MGYKPQETIYRLRFEDPKFEGLEVDTRSIDTGKLMKLMRLAVRFDGQSGEDRRKLSPEDVDAFDQLVDGFAGGLVAWNLEDQQDRPVPATKAGIEGQEFTLVLPVIMAWIEAVAGVSEELGKGSTSGPPSPEGSIPMEALSPSRSS